MDVVLIVLFLLSIASAIFSLNSEKRIESIIFLMLMTIFVSIIFLYVNANFVGIFQLLVYSGVLTVLFASSSYFLETSEPRIKNDKLGEVTTIE